MIATEESLVLKFIHSLDLWFIGSMVLQFTDSSLLDPPVRRFFGPIVRKVVSLLIRRSSMCRLTFVGSSVHQFDKSSVRAIFRSLVL